MPTRPAYKPISIGIQAVASRLNKQADGKPRLFIFNDALIQPDPSLNESRKPVCTADEFLGYVWDKGRTGDGTLERPIKRDDHGCFVAGTMVETWDGPMPIQDVKSGMMVLTRKDYRKVLDAACTDLLANVATVTFSDSRVMTGTMNHPVFVKNKGFVPLGDLLPGDRIIDIEENELCNRQKARHDVEIRVHELVEHTNRMPVYNLTVDEEHEFYANGTLVSNCDALRYFVAFTDNLSELDNVESGYFVMDGRVSISKF